MVDLIYVPEKIRVRKELKEKLLATKEDWQGLSGKIIEEELNPFVSGKLIRGMRLESNLGLHTLRINLIGKSSVGENELVVHMAKESLIAFELTAYKIGKTFRKGALVRFRKDVEAARIYDEGAPEEYFLSAEVFEKGISTEAIRSVGKIVDELNYKQVIKVFPSSYYEEWVQIHFENRKLLLRMDSGCLFGVGVGNFSPENDIIFHHDWGRILERYYNNIPPCLTSGCSYNNWVNAKIKLKSS